MTTYFLAANVVQDPNDETKWYYISTCDRDSSADFYPHRYAETIVWEWDVASQKRGDILKMDECSEGSVWKHDLIVSSLRLNGMNAFWDEEEEGRV